MRVKTATVLRAAQWSEAAVCNVNSSPENISQNQS